MAGRSGGGTKRNREYLRLLENNAGQVADEHVKRDRRRRDARYRSKYGISLDHLEALMVRQKHRCAICGKALTTRMNLDHDHDTGKIRGLLCPCCNRGLGLFLDDPALLTKAAQYLRQHGAG